MKKVFAFVAIVAMFAACNKPAQTQSEEAVDSVVTEVVEAVDSTVQVVDSTLNAAADSVAAAVN